MHVCLTLHETELYWAIAVLQIRCIDLLINTLKCNKNEGKML